MNNKSAHQKLKDINSQRNKIGVGGFKNSLRDRQERHEKFNETMVEMNKQSDEMKMEANNE